MLVYFDESYDNAHMFLLYGALFIPPSSKLHQRFDRVREETEFRGEVKYTKCRNQRALTVCKKVIDAFVDDTAYFRCAVVEQRALDYSQFGRIDEPDAIKRARAYKKFAEMLLHPFVEDVRDGVFLADRMTRCDGDDFLERIQERFNPDEGKRAFRHLEEVASHRVEYQCLQVCDLLLGCVLNNHCPPGNRYKTEIREHLCGRLQKPSLLLSSWKGVPWHDVKAASTKFHVWHWTPKKKGPGTLRVLAVVGHSPTPRRSTQA